MAGHVANQDFAGVVVEDLADHVAYLGEVVARGVQSSGNAPCHHPPYLEVTSPPVRQPLAISRLRGPPDRAVQNSHTSDTRQRAFGQAPTVA